MFKTKRQEFLFTLVTSGLMIFIMGVYNVALHSGGLAYATFGRAARMFPLEWLAGLICAWFIAGRVAKHFAFQVARPEDRPIVKILCIQSFTVCTMVPLMSLLGVLEASGLTMDLPVRWIETIVLNFIVAYPLQIFAVGPFCRKTMGWIFRKTSAVTA